jgi:hypothetical protein
MLPPPSSLRRHPAQNLLEQHQRTNCRNSRKGASTTTPSDRAHGTRKHIAACVALSRAEAVVGVSRPGGGPWADEWMSPCAPAQMGRREGGRKVAGDGQEREVEIPRPSCSSRAQVGCACSRGLQASTRVRERAALRERLSRPRPRAANLL